MTGPEPHVQPHPDPVWSPPEPAPRRPPWRPLGVLLCFAASILTLLASFLTLLVSSIHIAADDRFTATITSWGMQTATNGIADSTAGGPSFAATNGPLLIVAAVAMLAAAVVGLLASAAPGNVTLARAGSLTAVAAASFLVATAAAVLVQELNWIDWFSPRRQAEPVASEISFSTAIGLGFWLLMAGAAAAIAGAVLACLPLRRGLPRRSEPETPPLGVPVVVVHRLPDAPAEEPK